MNLSYKRTIPCPHSSSISMLQKEKQVPGGTKVRFKWEIMGNLFRMGAGRPWSPRRPPSRTVSTPAMSSSERLPTAS